MTKLVWMDCEMTGLDPFNDRLIEVAVVITTPSLQTIAQSPSYIIGQPLDILMHMDEWNTNQHKKSGLWDQVLKSDETVESVQEKLLAFLKEWGVIANTAPLCGSSIHQDRFFLKKWMPDLEQYVHYRNIDVSSFKEMLPLWCPAMLAFKKGDSGHRATEDVLQSIAELQHYHQYIQDLLQR